jgi:hypothetical protein
MGKYQDFVGVLDGNYRVEILYTFIRPNQEQLRKCNYMSLTGIEPA